jgi:hypothetical protein
MRFRQYSYLQWRTTTLITITTDTITTITITVDTATRMA